LPKQSIEVEGLARAHPDQAHATLYGDLIFTSLIGPRSASGDIGQQTREALQNLQQVLEAAGSSLKHLLKVTVYLGDRNGYAAMLEAYSAVVKVSHAWSCVLVQGLPAQEGRLVGVEAVAYRPRAEPVEGDIRVRVRVDLGEALKGGGGGSETNK
jgi:2-iminobutanoate/2-iminopropanoate deaminase